jgi:hypothetical protein
VRISEHLDNLLDALEDFEPVSLSDIVHFTKSHDAFSSALMLARNSVKSARYLLEQCNCLLEEGYPISDVQLAGLLVIVAEIDNEMYSVLVSRASSGAGEYHWSKGMATSYLLHKEVTSETIRKSA